MRRLKMITDEQIISFVEKYQQTGITFTQYHLFIKDSSLYCYAPKQCYSKSYIRKRMNKLVKQNILVCEKMNSYNVYKLNK